jgi:hypothetical protein
MTMLQDLVALRAQMADRHDALRARTPNTAYGSPAFAAALGPLAARLEEVARAMTDLVDAPPVEIGRSWMWYGDALFDLAQGGHVPLARAIAAYRTAEPFVHVARDRVLGAKMDGNLTNMLLRSEVSRALLRDVITRYQRAIEVLGATTPPTYRSELARARTQLEHLDGAHAETVARVRDARDLLASIAAHDLAPAAAAEMGRLAAELTSFAPPETLHDGQVILQTAQRNFARMMALANQPRVAPPSTRGGRVAAQAMQLWQELHIEAASYVDAEVRSGLYEVERALVEAAQALRATTTDAQSIEIERLRLRDVAAAGRQLLAHSHLTWIEPTWATPLSVTHDGSAHLVGADGARRAALAAICAARGLPIDDAGEGPDLAERRFNAMRRALVVVADLTGSADAQAAACYELGVALVLGKPIVVVADGALPFDIDIEPVRSADAAVIGAAIDRALYTRPRVRAAGAEDALAEVAAAARRRFPGQRFLMDTVDRQVEHPVGMATALTTVLAAHRLTTSGTPIIAYPAWRRRYPGTEPRVFHVMPFRAPWSDRVRDAAARAVEGAGATYRRHDAVAEPHILRSLWDELTSATHFLVDMTDLNLNVALELGVADALGTPSVVVGQLGTVERLFPMVRRVRVVTYAPDDTTALATACRQLVALR